MTQFIAYFLNIFSICVQNVQKCAGKEGVFLFFGAWSFFSVIIYIQHSKGLKHKTNKCKHTVYSCISFISKVGISIMLEVSKVITAKSHSIAFLILWWEENPPNSSPPTSPPHPGPRPCSLEFHILSCGLWNLLPCNLIICIQVLFPPTRLLIICTKVDAAYRMNQLMDS